MSHLIRELLCEKLERKVQFYVLCSAIFNFTLHECVSTETVPMPIPADCSQEALDEFRKIFLSKAGEIFLSLFVLVV